MKKIAIVTQRMITGGVEKALIAMLKQFDYKDVSVDLYVEHLGGELFSEIPKQVNVSVLQPIKLKDISKHPIDVFKKYCYLLKIKYTNMSFTQQSYILSKMLLPPLEQKNHYDIAIAYHAPVNVSTFYVIDKINANKKILWLHADPKFSAGSDPLAMKYHSMYDKVFAVSKSVLNSFTELHPNMASKTDLFYNYIDYNEIHKKADTGVTFNDSFKGAKILTIARLDHPKGLDVAVEICKKLIDSGYKIKWFICGDGPYRNTLETMIQENNLKQDFILLGNQQNPYGYLKNCDLYVQPSRHEGYCLTVNEARIFSKPIIATDFAGAREQLVDGVTGWIVPFDKNEIYNKITWCLSHRSEVETVCRRLSESMKQSNTDINKIFKD